MKKSASDSIARNTKSREVVPEEKARAQRVIDLEAAFRAEERAVELGGINTLLPVRRVPPKGESYSLLAEETA